MNEVPSGPASVPSTTPANLNELEETFNAEKLISDFLDKLKNWLAQFGIVFDPPIPEAGQLDEYQQERVDMIRDLTFTEIPGNVHRLVKRQGNMYTSGMFGRTGSSDGRYDINSPQAEANLRALVSEFHIQNIVTLCGSEAGSAVSTKLQELGIKGVNTLCFSIPSVETREEAIAAYDDDLIQSIGEAYNMCESGETLIHCQNGAHRSVCMSLIIYMLQHPDLNFAQAIMRNVSAREQSNGYFQSYVKLAEVLDNNEALRARIIAV